MGRVRKTSRIGKKGRVNTTAYGKKNKKKYGKSNYTVKMSSVRERWNPKMTLKNNLKNLGLVYDINSDIKPYGTKSRKSKGSGKEIEFMDIDTAMKMETGNNLFLEEDNSNDKPKTSKKAQSLYQEFETRSKRPVRKTCHLSTAETEYIITLMQKHGTDYMMMFRDKDNFDQLTENQLRKKCQELLRSREPRHLKKLKEMNLIA